MQKHQKLTTAVRLIADEAARTLTALSCLLIDARSSKAREFDTSFLEMARFRLDRER